MRPSRGMGDMKASKMPKGTTIVRKDKPQNVEMYAKGGSSKWIQGAIKKPGALKKSLGVPKDKPIPAKKLSAAAKKPGKLGRRARLAMTLKGLKRS